MMLRVRSKTDAKALAGALTQALKDADHAELHAVGAGAVNQAMKAVAIARGYAAPGGKELVCVPSFIEVEIKGDSRTGLRLLVLMHDGPIGWHRALTPRPEHDRRPVHHEVPVHST